MYNNYNSPASEFYMPTFWNTLSIIHLLAYEDETDSVPKRRHIKFTRRGITQKKSIQHTEHGESLKSRIKDDTIIL
jgi:hypothetical protein